MADRHSEIVELLRESDLLRSIPVPDLEQLTSRVHRSQYRAGEVIFSRRDAGDSVMFIASGRVKIVSVSSDGGEVILNFIEPGHVFGEISLLDGKPRSADAVAAVDTDLVTLYRRDLLPILRKNPDVSAKMMEILCERVRQATLFVEDAVLRDAQTRLLNRLKALARQLGSQRVGAGVCIQHGLSQQDLGDSVGLTRVSINRILHSWRERGLIEDGRGFTIVHDLNELETAVHLRLSD
jgi:CRP-like cAMP-binding protein